MSANPKRPNDDKSKGSMETGPPGSNANRVASPGILLQEMSRSGYVPGYPAPGTFPGFPGRSWQDIPPFLLGSFMPPVPLGMDMLSTALLHSLQGSSMYPSPTSLPMMRSPMGLMQPPFNTPIFTSNDSLRSSPPVPKQHKQDPGSVGLKQRASKRTPSETNIYAQTLEQMVPQKSKELPEAIRHYSPIVYNSPRTKSNKSVEESIVIRGDDESLDVIKISDDNNAPLALVTKKKPQTEFAQEKAIPNLGCQSERASVVVAPPPDEQRKITEESILARTCLTPIQAPEERPSSKPGAVRSDALNDQVSEHDFPEQKTMAEVDQSVVSSKHSIALPPRKRLLRNAEDLSDLPVVSSIPSSAAIVFPTSSNILPSTASVSMPSSDSPQSSNFRSCWKKFSAKMNNHCQPVHRSYHAAGKPMYDCRAFFQKMSGKDSCKPGVLIGKPYLSGNRFYHRARYTPRKEPPVQQEGSSSPRITRSQARQKKVSAEESGSNANPTSAAVKPDAVEPQEVPQVRKSLRKKTSNSRYDAPDIVVPGAKARKPRNSRKNQEDSKPPSSAGDAPNELMASNLVDKPDEAKEQASRSKKEDHNRSGSAEQTPDKAAQSEDLPHLIPGSVQEESKASSESRRLDSCDRKSTSSGLSTCSGDVSFDPEFPVSLPPKFRHTKRKSNFAGFLAEDRTIELALTAPLPQESPIITTSSSVSTSTIATTSTNSLTEASLSVNDVDVTSNSAVDVRHENLELAKVETSKEESTVGGENILSLRSAMAQREASGNNLALRAADDAMQSAAIHQESARVPTSCHVESRPQGPTKITLKFDSDTISTVISTGHHLDACLPVGSSSSGKNDPCKKSVASFCKQQEGVSEFRLKIDLTELNKKSEEQGKRAVVVLMPETSSSTDASKDQSDTTGGKNQKHSTTKTESSGPSSRSNEVISCTRKVEIPGSSKPKTISVLLRSRGDAETSRSSGTTTSDGGQTHPACREDITPAEHFNEETNMAATSVNEEVNTTSNRSMSRTPRSEKRRKKGKGTRQKRQKRRQSVGEEAPPSKADDHSNSSTTPIILPSNTSCSSLVGIQNSNSPPQLEMTSQLTYADQFSDISDSDAGKVRTSEALSSDGRLQEAGDVADRGTIARDGGGYAKQSQTAERGSGQKASSLNLRTKKKAPASSIPTAPSASGVSSTALATDSKVSFGPSNGTPTPATAVSITSSSVPSTTNAAAGQEGKSVDIYDWSVNNECDTNDLDDIMKVRQNRLASRLMASTSQPLSSTAPLKKRFLPSENLHCTQNFDSLLSTCKSVSVVVQKLEKDGQELCENSTPGLAPDQAPRSAVSAVPPRVSSTKKRRKKTKQSRQDSKKTKISLTPHENFFSPGDAFPTSDQRIFAKPAGPTSASPPAPVTPLRPSNAVAALVAPARETRIPPSIRIPRPVISNPVAQPQGDAVPDAAEGKVAPQGVKASKGAKADQSLSVPVKFKLKKIGRQWISVNDREAGKAEDASLASQPKKDKERNRKGQREAPSRSSRSSRMASIFMPDSLTCGFVCNDELVQQAFTEKVLISEFLRNFPAPETSTETAPNVSFKFVFDAGDAAEASGECEVPLMVDPKEVFFAPDELESLMSSLTLDESAGTPGDRVDAVFAHQVTSSEDADLKLLKRKTRSGGDLATEDGREVLSTGSAPTCPSTDDYRWKDQLLSVLQDSEEAVNLDDFKMEAKSSRNPSSVPLFDEMTACNLETSDDPWDIFGYHIINVMM